MDTFLITLLGGFLYLIIGILLFVMNIVLFEWWTPFNVKYALLEVQNKAVAHIIRGNILGQGIIIGSVIFFTGYTPDHEFLQPAVFLPSIGMTIFFGIMGMLVQNAIMWGVMKMGTMEKEIIVDKNEALGMVLGSFVVAFSVIMSIAFYSY